jgi:DNA-binding XRE family transcriptional regulator
MIASELKNSRKILGLSQEDLANKIGLTREFIGFMERNKNPIDIRTELSIKYLLLKSGYSDDIYQSVDSHKNEKNRDRHKT